MVVVSVANVAANFAFTAHASWAPLPIAVLALLGADGARGHAAGAGPLPATTRAGLVIASRDRSTANGIAAGRHCTTGDALTRTLAPGVAAADDERGPAGLAWLHRRWPEIGRRSKAQALSA